MYVGWLHLELPFLPDFASENVFLFISFPFLGHRFTDHLKPIINNQSIENTDTGPYITQTQSMNRCCAAEFCIHRGSLEKSLSSLTSVAPNKTL